MWVGGESIDLAAKGDAQDGGDAVADGMNPEKSLKPFSSRYIGSQRRIPYCVDPLVMMLSSNKAHFPFLKNPSISPIDEQQSWLLTSIWLSSSSTLNKTKITRDSPDTASKQTLHPVYK